MKTEISGTTRFFGLIGTPVGHSGSPAMYNYCFEKDGLDYAYGAFETEIDQVETVLNAAKALRFKGLNVTMPCKNEVVKYMDSLSPAAALIGACNAIIIQDGKMTGYNTDGLGFVKNLEANGISIKGRRLTVIGAGGAGIAVQAQCALDGAAKIAVFNPKDTFYSKAEEKIQSIGKAVPTCDISLCDLADQDRLKVAVEQSDILVNATKMGMAPYENESVISDKTLFRQDLIVADVVYNPKETRLMREAKMAGCRLVLGGIGMLVRQGAENYKLFTGLTMPVDEVEKRFF